MILNEKTAFYKVCFDSMQLGIIVFDKNKKIVLANHPSASILGYKQQDILNKNVSILFKNAKIFDNFIQKPNSNIFKSTIELSAFKSTGEEVFIELNFGKMEYDNELFFKALISDISLRKQKEEKITHLNIQLEEEVKLRNLELEKLIEQLKISLNKEKELNNLKTKFIALASHEFKTPLSAILSSTELMNKYADLDNVEKRKEHLDKIKVMINRLNSMLDDFLNLENIELGIVKPTFTLFKLENLIEYVLQNINPLLKKNQHIKFIGNREEFIYHDQKILNVILSNLLNNAIKYSFENSNIEVKISTNDNNIYLNIKDDGIGIPKNEQNLIFNRFFRAKNAMYFPGTGIGLNIVKGYINNLNGNISFNSTENKGTIFKVQLPKINSYEKKGITN